MTPSDYRLLIASIQHHEGLSLHPTPDRHGTLVIGYGRNLTRTGISPAESEYLLDNDVADRFATLPVLWTPFAACDGPRQRLLIELAYQLGSEGVLLFPKMLHALAIGDYASAAQELRASALAKQTPGRVADYVELVTA